MIFDDVIRNCSTYPLDRQCENKDLAIRKLLSFIQRDECEIALRLYDEINWISMGIVGRCCFPYAKTDAAKAGTGSFENLFSIEGEVTSTLLSLSETGGRIHGGFIPISSNGGGNLLGIFYEKNNYNIGYWIHDEPGIEGVVGKGNTHFVAESIERLAEITQLPPREEDE